MGDMSRIRKMDMNFKSITMPIIKLKALKKKKKGCVKNTIINVMLAQKGSNRKRKKSRNKERERS